MKNLQNRFVHFIDHDGQHLIALVVDHKGGDKVNLTVFLKSGHITQKCDTPHSSAMANIPETWHFIEKEK